MLEMTPRHRYPTRWKLVRHSSLSLATRVEDAGKDNVFIPCKRKKEEKRNLHLPREIIFNILVLIPAKDLHEVVKYVCKQWYDIVNDPLFVIVHHRLSSSCFLIQDPNEMLQAYSIDAEGQDGARLKVTEIRFPSPVRVLGSLNGLVLLHDVTSPDILHVMNLVTKEKISLPPLVGLNGVTGFALNSSGHYKVVHVSDEVGSIRVQMRVFTVGVDKAWRFIDVQDIFRERRSSIKNLIVKITLLYRPYFIAGFIYWFSLTTLIGFALDVDCETIYQFNKPTKDIFENCRSVRFVCTATRLGVIKDQVGRDLWRMWELTDVKTSEWTEVAGINMVAVLRKLNKMFYPISCCALFSVWLIDQVFWFYRRIGEEFVVVRFNLADESVVFFPIKNVVRSTLLIPHVHTLLSPKYCLA